MRLGAVEQVFEVRGRGVLIYVGNWESGRIELGDWIEIRAADGFSRTVQVKSIDMVRFVPGSRHLVDQHNPGVLLLSDVQPGEVQVGDAVWTASPPTVG